MLSPHFEVWIGLKWRPCSAHWYMDEFYPWFKMPPNSPDPLEWEILTDFQTGNITSSLFQHLGETLTMNFKTTWNLPGFCFCYKLQTQAIFLERVTNLYSKPRIIKFKSFESSKQNKGNKSPRKQRRRPSNYATASVLPGMLRVMHADFVVTT